MKHNYQLDAMRAIAALAIIAYHYTLFPCGWIGVQFFFVLSGFLISGIVIKYRAASAGKQTGAFFKDFYKRRALRLFPLYFGYIGILALFNFFAGKPEAFDVEWPWLITYAVNFRWLFQGYTFHMVYGHLWSLALEWQFYMVWPFFLWFVPQKRITTILLWLLPLSMVIRALGYTINEHLPYLVGFNGDATAKALAPYVLPFSHIDAFVFGALLCKVKVRRFLSKPQVIYTCMALVVITGLMLVAVIPSYTLASMGWPSNLPLAYQWVWGYSLLNLTSAAIIAGIVEKGNARILALSRSSVLQYLGKISYGIYVYHPIVIFAMLNFRDKVPAFTGKPVFELLIVIGITVAIAHLSYEKFEKRFLTKRKPQPLAQNRPLQVSEAPAESLALQLQESNN
ncbi:acyltransferase [Mucilaginibacter sp. UR6-1]|uniref:acyltransferase family protein n=1 Tax=Mucilaginibacter sp. UR6-1 TaxID=1435643 RepID=UPI001E4178BD|nr:acyltransferase [Mucilaginibacter sp. UR6-1]MCC8408164.1 acyltransferase [Mucilaginibacter sp. UR6-1]